ncbi:MULTISPECIES: YibE/F family protein [Psychrilyobacter]|uniref:YibE/F family protein n=1 Tax=Psychrilyobacter piezotolerans TaxID=2293438 RepID=A0ABX9KFK2_9FUSO|nr:MULTISPECIES: YibE/F family protein [Psychrilyobacter]MCS5421283.1 YibE/F family protein [Psychrilyobacter sp. S5]NDI78146.1 YibE/F family protein [Psychrilyobacter piezotolerans]RDE60162.1 YibE/F family protein [Psychrilyobacter sp. S5]REI40344.1 YibE/F family protein [Psychrilyobacter piezotolerans]
MKKKLIIGIFFIIGISIFAEQTYVKGKILSILREEEFADDEFLISMTDFQVEIMEGEEKGKILVIPHPAYREKEHNLSFKPNMNVVIYRDTDGYYIVERDRRNSLYLLVSLFLGLTLFIAKKQGLKAVLSLGITGFLIFKFMIPGIILGFSPILISIIILSISSVVTIFFMTGFNSKGIIAILGTLGGVVFAGILSIFFSKTMGLTGYTTMESINYASLIKNIDLKELISTGVIIGSAGAVMDVSMSISSALSEIKSHKPHITPLELYNSGMSIGRDIIGTMINTLILAYIGGSLFTIMILTIQQNDFPGIRILNFEFVGVEFLRAFCGSIGILIAVPLTSFLASKIHIHNKEKKIFWD